MQARLTFDRDRCKGCELCISVCPKHILALDMTSANVKGYHPAGVTDLSQCIACASCARICPDSVITVEKESGGRRIYVPPYAQTGPGLCPV